ncbi:hypothetical protein [Delftia phage PhiW-14]|uniref:Uncharacterized protein n=1 Tax=Delftia phage PhiW-14 TaxID=665032 RepID=C9DGE0_BPW14|nr:hypothetical protein DP-phiW-14_gp170 [Delftia phage PhiW-14]ACV50191.1 hypothetical protein [Delftia phage PhiW-14]
MTKTFNPFREALAYLNTPHDMDRGGINLKVRNSFVCFAIERAGANLSDENRHLCKMATAYIDSMIITVKSDDSPTIIKWLRVNSPEFRASEAGTKDHALKYDLLQAYRWRWLTHMADQYDQGLINL